MILRITQYGEPILRQRGARITALTPEIEQLITDMFDTMESANGIGLAAQQVGHALQLAVLDVRPAAPDRPSTLTLNGAPADPASLMPMVLINPVVTPIGKPVLGPEGCLSFPKSSPTSPAPNPSRSARSMRNSSRSNSSAADSSPAPSSTRPITCKASSSSTA